MTVIDWQAPQAPWLAKLMWIPRGEVGCASTTLCCIVRRALLSVAMATHTQSTLLLCSLFQEITTTGVNKKPKNQTCLAWILGNFKTVWQGKSGKLKTVCRFFKYCLLDFINIFLRCKLLDLTVSLKNRGGFCPHSVQISNSVSIQLFQYCLPDTWTSVHNHTVFV